MASTAQTTAPSSGVTQHPLLFTFRDVVSGEGFLAGIALSGRILAVEEDSKWWVYGVRPAAIAENGESIPEALMHFRARYREVLFDIADEYATFPAFKQEVKRFFDEADLGEDQKWGEALEKIRSENLTPPAAFSSLPRKSTDERPPSIVVERLDAQNKRFRPTDNKLDVVEYSAIAA